MVWIYFKTISNRNRPWFIPFQFQRVQPILHHVISFLFPFCQGVQFLIGSFWVKLQPFWFQWGPQGPWKPIPCQQGKVAKNPCQKGRDQQIHLEGLPWKKERLWKKEPWKKKTLAKLRKMTMAEKIKKAAEDAETAGEAAQNLRGMMDKSDRSKAWSKRNISMKGKTAKERKELERKSKREKAPAGGNVHGEAELAPVLQYQRKCVPEPIHWQRGKSGKVNSRWWRNLESEFYAHLQSGRIEWRHDPWTPRGLQL